MKIQREFSMRYFRCELRWGRRDDLFEGKCLFKIQINSPNSEQTEHSETLQCDWSAWFPFFPSAVPKKSQGFETPKFWHSISSDAELLDEDLEDELETTTTHHEPLPFFDEEQTQVNETTQLGNELTILHCRVQNLGEKTVSAGKFLNSFFPYHHTSLRLTDDKSRCFHFCYKVSWVRRKGDQLHLLTFGDSLYSSDSRYSFKFKSPNDWQLHIQYANERDEGQFECQINTSPTLVFIVYLIVVGKYELRGLFLRVDANGGLQRAKGEKKAKNKIAKLEQLLQSAI